MAEAWFFVKHFVFLTRFCQPIISENDLQLFLARVLLILGAHVQITQNNNFVLEFTELDNSLMKLFRFPDSGGRSAAKIIHLFLQILSVSSV